MAPRQQYAERCSGDVIGSLRDQPTSEFIILRDTGNPWEQDMELKEYIQTHKHKDAHTCTGTHKDGVSYMALADLKFPL